LASFNSCCLEIGWPERREFAVPGFSLQVSFLRSAKFDILLGHTDVSSSERPRFIAALLLFGVLTFGVPYPIVIIALVLLQIVTCAWISVDSNEVGDGFTISMRPQGSTALKLTLIFLTYFIVHDSTLATVRLPSVFFHSCDLP
jgi:hypothetical protein